VQPSGPRHAFQTLYRRPLELKSLRNKRISGGVDVGGTSHFSSEVAPIAAFGVEAKHDVSQRVDRRSQAGGGWGVGGVVGGGAPSRRLKRVPSRRAKLGPWNLFFFKKTYTPQRLFSGRGVFPRTLRG
jgi:hypothetical protein